MFVREFNKEQDIGLHSYTPCRDGTPAQYSWKFKKANGGYLIRKQEKGQVIGYYNGKTFSRPRVYDDKDARLIIWSIVPAEE
jgi:hypothetical protein